MRSTPDNELYKEKLQFSRYWTETCFILFYIPRQLIWAIVEPDSTKNKDVKPFGKLSIFTCWLQNILFSRFKKVDEIYFLEAIFLMQKSLNKKTQQILSYPLPFFLLLLEIRKLSFFFSYIFLSTLLPSLAQIIMFDPELQKNCKR